jgi:hypothetical protein
LKPGAAAGRRLGIEGKVRLDGHALSAHAANKLVGAPRRRATRHHWFNEGQRYGDAGMQSFVRVFVLQHWEVCGRTTLSALRSLARLQCVIDAERFEYKSYTWLCEPCFQHVDLRFILGMALGELRMQLAQHNGGPRVRHGKLLCWSMD